LQKIKFVKQKMFDFYIFRCYILNKKQFNPKEILL